MTEPRNPAPQPSAGETPALPKRSVPELIQALRARAFFASGASWEAPATAAMLNEAAEALATSEQEKATLREALQLARACIRDFGVQDADEWWEKSIAQIDAALSSTGPNTETR